MFKLDIVLGNDAMLSPLDVSRALAAMVPKIRKISGTLFDSGKILDRNGNTVGHWSYEPASE